MKRDGEQKRSRRWDGAFIISTPLYSWDWWKLDGGFFSTSGGFLLIPQCFLSMRWDTFPFSTGAQAVNVDYRLQSFTFFSFYNYFFYYYLNPVDDDALKDIDSRVC